MTKVVLGATKGSIDGNEFDIADNVLQVVKDYERRVAEVNVYANQKVAEIEKETLKKRAELKAELVKTLTGFMND
jgi:hypothetical protein